LKFAVLSEMAEEDLADIYVNIALDQPVNADRFIDELRAKMQRLAEQPMIGRARPELGKDVRSFPHAAYVVIYRPNSVGIGVARVLRGSRDLSDVEVPEV
jgi:toxin ParE1/3/4